MNDYQKTQLQKIIHFTATEFIVRPTTQGAKPTPVIDTLKLRSGTTTSIFLVTKALIELTDWSKDYTVGFHLAWQSPFLKLNSRLDDAPDIYVFPSHATIECPVDLIPTNSLDDATFPRWYSTTQHFTDIQLLDTLIREFPFVDFSFLCKQ